MGTHSSKDKDAQNANNNSSSTPSSTSPSTQEVEELRAKQICWAMPSWCIQDYHVTSKEIDLANDSWRYCLSGTAPPYLLARKKEPGLTPLVFFYNQFYYLLFELLPEVKPLFKKGMQAQGRMLANVVKYIITNLREESALTFRDSLEHLARVHNARGISADQYSVMGMSLIHTVRICCGSDFWDENTHKQAWVQIYSKMMSVIIPVVVSGEIEGLEQVQSTEYVKSAYNPNLNEGADVVPTKGSTPVNSHAESPSHSGSTPPPTKGLHSPAPSVGGCPVGHTTTLTSAITASSGGGCPALSRAGTADEGTEEISENLHVHFKQTQGSKDVNKLRADLNSSHNGSEASTSASNDSNTSSVESTEVKVLDKYTSLKRILSISQQLEVQCRDAATMAPSASSLSQNPTHFPGKFLIDTLLKSNLVPDKKSALQACQTMLTLQLVRMVANTQLQPDEVNLIAPNDTETSSASVMIQGLPIKESTTFHPTHILYEFVDENDMDPKPVVAQKPAASAIMTPVIRAKRTIQQPQPSESNNLNVTSGSSDASSSSSFAPRPYISPIQPSRIIAAMDKHDQTFMDQTTKENGGVAHRDSKETSPEKQTPV